MEWRAAAGLESGYLRFRPHGAPERVKPEHDPHAIELWGFKKESGTTALLAAAVAARLPHPSAGPDKALTAGAPARPALEAPAPTAPPASGAAPADDHDTLLRRLRELGELRREGILTEEEFTTTKAAVLERFHTTD